MQLRLIKHKRKDGLIWKCTKCKVTTKSIRQNSTFHNSKITIYQIIVLTFQLTKKGSTKNASALVGISNKTAAEWSKHMRNVCTRILLKLDMTMGGRNKKAQLDETHFFSIPKHFRGRWRIYRNWLFVVVNEDSAKFYYQLV